MNYILKSNVDESINIIIDNHVIVIGKNDVDGVIVNDYVYNNLTPETKKKLIITAVADDMIQQLFPSLSTVATSGDYNDLNNRPNIRQIIRKDPDLSKVAFSGNYADLVNKPDFEDINVAATYDTLGSIIVGNGLSIDCSGVLSNDIEGIHLNGVVKSLNELNNKIKTANSGDAYVVNTHGAEPNLDGRLYVFDSVKRIFINGGHIQGPQGPQGERGNGLKIDYVFESVSDMNEFEYPNNADLCYVNGYSDQDKQFYRYSDANCCWEKITLRGEIGPQGPRGIQGIQGIQGETGPQGIQGEKGDTGKAFTRDMFTEEDLCLLTGPTGAKGDTGETGPIGPQGEKGAKGNRGKRGPQGLQGERGIQGEQGPQGIKGEIGPTGPRGLQGERGAQGERGPQGIKGEIGPTGPMGTIRFGVLTQDQVSQLKGDTGETGAIGPTGPRGEQGPQGETAEIKIKAVLDGTEKSLDELIEEYDLKVGDMIVSNADTTYEFICSYDGKTLVKLEAKKGDIILYTRNASQYCPGHKGYHTGIPMWKNIGPLSGPIGPTGPAGTNGRDGIDGINGRNGATGATGPTGRAGKSAYTIAVEKGFIGTEAQFIDSLKGSDGINGKDGKSAYDIWIESGNSGDKVTFLSSLKGPTGEQGSQGAKGDTGDPGAMFKIVAVYDTFEELAAAQPQGSIGDANIVDGYIYIYNSQYESGANAAPEDIWINTGVEFTAVNGKDGLTTSINLQGVIYEHVDGVITIDKINADTINGKKIITLTEEEYNNSIIDNDTIYIVTDAKDSAGNADTIDGKHLWSGTKAEYEALTDKTEDTVYIITDAEDSTGNADTIDGKHLWSGTKVEYEALTDKTEDTVYIITDAEDSTSNADMVDGKHFWSGTKAEYDSLIIKDENTVYIITDAENTDSIEDIEELIKNADVDKVDGKHIVTLKQAEYDAIIPDENTIYIITDAVNNGTGSGNQGGLGNIDNLPANGFPGAILTINENGSVVWADRDDIEIVKLDSNLEKKYEVGTVLTKVEMTLKGNKQLINDIISYSVVIIKNEIQVETEEKEYNGKIIIDTLEFETECEVEIFVNLTINDNYISRIKTNSIYIDGVRAAFFGSLYIDEEYLFNMTDGELINNNLIYPRILSGYLLNPKSGDIVRLATHKGDNVICIAYPIGSIDKLQGIYSEASGDEFIDAFTTFNSKYNEYTGEQEQIMVPGAFNNGEAVGYEIYILTHKDGFGSNSFVIRF